MLGAIRIMAIYAAFLLAGCVVKHDPKTLKTRKPK
jgi:hypothetical protein